MLAAPSFRAAARRSLRMMSTKTPYYSPTLVEARPGEAGRGGRASVAGVKVALFGASGFLGRYVCAELGRFLAFLISFMSAC